MARRGQQQQPAAAGFSVPLANLGLFLDRPPEDVPPGGLVAGNNFRIQLGKIRTDLLGKTTWQSALNGPVALISPFALSAGGTLLVLGTLTDLYSWNNGSPVYITPVYNTGTIAVSSGGVVTGTGTAFKTVPSGDVRSPVQAGDYIFIGSSSKNDPSATWWKVASVASDTSLTLANYTGGTVSGGTAYTARQCFTGTLDNAWSATVFPNAASINADAWFGTNGKDSIVSWTGSGFCTRQSPTLGFTCNALVLFKDQMLYLGLTTYAGNYEPYSMTNSDAGAPLTVNGSGISDTYVVSDSAQPILNAVKLYNNIVVYWSNQIILATYVGDPIGYVFSTIVTGRGPLSGRLVANFGYFHKFIAQEGQWLFNGIGLEITGTQVFRSMIQSVDLTRINRSLVVFDPANGDLIWALPLTTDTLGYGPETAFVEHYLEPNEPGNQPPFSQRDFVATAVGSFTIQTSNTFNELTSGFNTYSFAWNSTSFSGNFPAVLQGDKTGAIYVLNNSNSVNGAAYASSVTFPPRPLMNLRNKGLVKRVYPSAEQVPNATYSLTVTVNTYDRLGGDVIGTSTTSYDLTQASNRFTNPYIVGRLAQVTFSTTGPNMPWVLHGYDLDVVPAGAR